MTTLTATSSLEHCSQLLAGLALTLRVELDGQQFRTYHRVLQRVPPLLLVRAVDAAAESCVHFPKPAELLALAERERVALLAAHAFTPCAACETSPGWRETFDDAGVVRLTRCDCYRAWQQRLAELGAGGTALVRALLPPVREPAPTLLDEVDQ